MLITYFITSYATEHSSGSAVVPVQVQHHVKTDHSKLKEKGIENFWCIHHELFKSQNLLQLFNLEVKKKSPTLTGQVRTFFGWKSPPSSRETADVAERPLGGESVKCRAVPLCVYHDSSNQRFRYECEDWVHILFTELYFCLTNEIYRRGSTCVSTNYALKNFPLLERSAVNASSDKYATGWITLDFHGSSWKNFVSVCTVAQK